MTAVQATTGRGGWPLSRVPDARPASRSSAARTSRRRTATGARGSVRAAPGRRRVARRGDRTHVARRRAGPRRRCARMRRTARGRDPGRRVALPRVGAVHCASVRPGPRRLRAGARSSRTRSRLLVPAGAGARGRRPAVARRWSSATLDRDGAAAASTIRSAAASIATRPTANGWCPTSRRCSTTRPCSPRLPRGLAAHRRRDSSSGWRGTSLDYVLAT